MLSKLCLILKSSITIMKCRSHTSMVWDSCHNTSSEIIRQMHPLANISAASTKKRPLPTFQFDLQRKPVRSSWQYQFRRIQGSPFHTQPKGTMDSCLLVSGHPILSIPLRMSCKLESLWILPGAIASSNDQVKRICRKLFRWMSRVSLGL